MVVLCAYYIGSWLGLIAKTVRPYIQPYIDWLEYLKSWLKKTIRYTTKHIRRCYLVACCAALIYYPFYYLIWWPIYASVDLVRGYIMEFLKPDLKRERFAQRTTLEDQCFKACLQHSLVRLAPRGKHEFGLRSGGPL
jgi:hypothetical protein